MHFARKNSWFSFPPLLLGDVKWVGWRISSPHPFDAP